MRESVLALRKAHGERSPFLNKQTHIQSTPQTVVWAFQLLVLKLRLSKHLPEVRGPMLTVCVA